MKKHRVLIVDDDSDFRSAIAANLGRFYDVVGAQDSKEALSTLQKVSFDLIILDLTLPDGHGVDLCVTFREKLKLEKIPIIILTGNATPDIRVKSFDSDADDILEKPVRPDELKARIDRLIRKSETLVNNVVADSLFLENIKIDLLNHKILILDEKENAQMREFSLTKVELVLCTLFFKNMNQILTREQLRASVWGSNLSRNERTIDIYVGRLARKLNQNQVNLEIKNVRGLGYQCCKRDLI